ncbi:MAG: hypothetical protein K9J12_09005 [Melioribacteraceae bacterium]|nr:hypothetical protein [Melioribacteraceae bacterium]MCF8265668.1 hypothetical protein [Melioribacteraceae bacterium]MCF8414482.1 hypothetical protein [Melioribacteraceae bacterium]
MSKLKIILSTSLVAIVFLSVIPSCSEEDASTAPYVGSPVMSNVLVEEASFEPRITWLGGYASVLAVNKGTKSILDTSLIWLIKTEGNSLKYPVEFGVTPTGATDITSNYGGIKVDNLDEDESYSFWVMKEEIWNQISAQSGKEIVIDSSLQAAQVVVSTDSIKLSTEYFTSYSKDLDVFLNIADISTFGQLGVISVTEDFSDKPIISWTITQSGVSDTEISVIGICEGSQYDPGKTIWDVYSEADDNGSTVYGTVNVIKSPLNVGDTFEQTRAFVPFDADGLERNKTYYIWIANDIWDGESRLRFAKGYAYATFNTN